MRTRWVTYKNYSGYIVDGGPIVELSPTEKNLHVMRAVWLTSRLEGSHFGTVQGYDGAGMSAGLLHNIAVFPRTLEQGSFFALLARVMTASPADAEEVREALGMQGWQVGRDGVLRNVEGVKVSGREIRNEFSGPEGKVPRRGSERQRAWAERFHRLFAAQGAHLAQIDYAAEWLAAGYGSTELDIYKRFTLQPSLDSFIGLPSVRLPPEIDIAMCVYHAFSVNAPAIAKGCLDAALPLRINEKAIDFAKRLIRKLGAKKYAAWQDEPGEGGRSRYDKTRRAVWSSPFWDTGLARELMPVDL